MADNDVLVARRSNLVSNQIAALRQRGQKVMQATPHHLLFRLPYLSLVLLVFREMPVDADTQDSTRITVAVTQKRSRQHTSI